MKCFLFGADNSSPDTSTSQYNRLNSIFPSSWTSNETLRRLVMPVAVDLSYFYIGVDAAPGVGSSFTYTILKNGAATPLAVTIADNATFGENTSHAVSFAPGDTVSVQSTPTGTPNAPSNQYWNIQVNGVGSSALLLTGLAAASTSATQYGSMLAGHGAAAGWATAEADLQVVVPTSGSLSNMYANVSTAPGSGRSYAFTVMVNGVASSLAATVSNTATTGSDTVNSVAINAGDTLTIRSVPTGSPAGSTPSFGIAFTPNNTGENFMGFGSASVPSATVTNYEQLLGIGNLGWAASESSRYMMPGPCTLRGLHIKLVTAPGVGASRTFTIRKSTGDTQLAVTISGTSTTGSVAGNVECAQGEYILLKSSISGAPAAATGGVHAGLLLYNDPKNPVMLIY